jgi:hypothetical protein
MKPLFQSAVLQMEFEENGLVKVPLLSAIEAQELLTSYQSVATAHEKINIPYITTSHSNDSVLITHVDEVLQKVIAPALSKVLSNYNLLFGNYLVKMPVTKSETEPHQDITFVDETEFASVNVWVALQDTNEENGGMYFLKGSHNLMPTLRPTHDYPWAYENVKEEIKKQSQVFTAKAGDAFIFNHAVVHGSFPNRTKHPRIAAVIAAYPSDAQLLHYYLPEGEKNKVQQYSMTKEAFLHFKKGEPPAKGIFLKEVNFDFKQLSKTEFGLLKNNKYKPASLFSVVSKFLKGN